MKITTMKDEKMSHNNPAFRNSTVTLGMPQEPRESYLSSNEFISKSIEIDKVLSWFAQFYCSFPREIWTNLVSFFLSQTTSNQFGFSLEELIAFFLFSLFLLRIVRFILFPSLFCRSYSFAWLDLAWFCTSKFTAIYGSAHSFYELNSIPATHLI